MAGKAHHIALAKGPHHLEATSEELNKRTHERAKNSCQCRHCWSQGSTHYSGFSWGTLHNCMKIISNYSLPIIQSKLVCNLLWDLAKQRLPNRQLKGSQFSLNGFAFMCVKTVLTSTSQLWAIPTATREWPGLEVPERWFSAIHVAAELYSSAHAAWSCKSCCSTLSDLPAGEPPVASRKYPSDAEMSKASRLST